MTIERTDDLAEVVYLMKIVAVEEVPVTESDLTLIGWDIDVTAECDDGKTRIINMRTDLWDELRG